MNRLRAESGDGKSLSASTGSIEPGGHLLSLFVPPSGGAIDSPVETRARKYVQLQFKW